MSVHRRSTCSPGLRTGVHQAGCLPMDGVIFVTSLRYRPLGQGI